MKKKSPYTRRSFLGVVSATLPMLKWTPAMAWARGISHGSRADPVAFPASQAGEGCQGGEWLSFQTHAPWSPRLNVGANIAIVYGIDPTVTARVQSWRDHGYRVELMTGVAWGSYRDYIYGEYDGKNHEDEAQTDEEGHKIIHGSSREAKRPIYYMVPTEPYVRYLQAGIKRGLDAGVEAVYMEEPELWVRSGYSEAFKCAWRAHYLEEWQPPHSSVDAQYRASKLKYHLYRQALAAISSFVRGYGRKAGREIGFYVATHSLLNYSQWRIVSPESSLELIDCDGYIAQVWTGTSRTPNVCEGKKKERTFETAFLEYGVTENLSRVSGRQLWFLNDPVEDNPNHSWADYRKNWQDTIVGSLLRPEVRHYEVMPWPHRVFEGKYPVEGISERQHGKPVERELIPGTYASELQVVIRALGEMKQSPQSVQWEHCGTEHLGILVSDTMMFERGKPGPSDANLGSFYGLALPLVMGGMLLKPVQIEYAVETSSLQAYKLLLLTYEGQKPPVPAFHEALADWVRAGGALVVVDNDKDPYNRVRAWWNSAPMSYRTPRQHLFEKLGVDPEASGLHQRGKGIVLWERLSPAALGYEASGSRRVKDLARQAAAAVNLVWKESGALVLRRGPYLIASALDVLPPGDEPVTLSGRFVDLFDSALPVISSIRLTAGTRRLLLDLDRVEASKPRVLAAACRICDEKTEGNTLQFRAEGIAETKAIVRVLYSGSPSAVSTDGRPLPKDAYSVAEGTLLLRFPNSAKGVQVEIRD